MRHRALAPMLLFPFSLLAGGVVMAHEWSPRGAPPAGLTARSTRMVYDPVRARVVLFGGIDGVRLNDTWIFDGSSWTSGPAAPGALSPRLAGAMAFDLQRSVVVLFGGYDGATRKDTWELATSWTAAPAGPIAMPARTDTAMTYDVARGRMVLFGGDSTNTGTGLLSDTWEYDGTAWTPGAAAPPGLTARSTHAMAYDQIRSRVVLFGGFDGTLRNDTWNLTGAGWSLGVAAPATLTPRSGHGMAFEATPGRILLFGGFDASGYRNDTWELDGLVWEGGGATPAGLEPRYGFGITYDTARGVALVFGGFDGATPYFSDTWEYRPTHHFMVGAGLGPPNPNRVRMFEDDGTAMPVDFLAYGANAWGVNVATGSIDDGSNDEILTGPGPGPVFGPQIRSFDQDGTAMGKVNFFAYGTLKFGANVAAIGTDGDRYLEILSGAGPGAVFGPHVRGFDFDASSIRPIAKINYFAYATLRFGVNVEGGNVDGDAFEEITTAPGPGPTFGPQVRGWNVDGGTAASMAKINFVAFPAPQYGASVTAGYVDLDGFAEIVATPGPGPGLPSRFLGFDYDNAAITAAPGFDITRFATTYGGRVGLGGIASAVKLDLIIGPGTDPSASALVESYVYTGTALTQIGSVFDAFAGYSYGVNVNAHLGGD